LKRDVLFREGKLYPSTPNTDAPNALTRVDPREGRNLQTPREFVPETITVQIPSQLKIDPHITIIKNGNRRGAAADGAPIAVGVFVALFLCA